MWIWKRFSQLSIKGKITERWLVEREGIFFLIEEILENFENSRAINP